MTMKKTGGGIDMKGIYAEYVCEHSHTTKKYENDLDFRGYNNAPDMIDDECDECNA